MISNTRIATSGRLWSPGIAESTVSTSTAIDDTSGQMRRRRGAPDRCIAEFTDRPGSAAPR
ncbi:MAG: hypothetical protein U0Q19_06940 [Kineosporiaceae bacterium]